MRPTSPAHKHLLNLPVAPPCPFTDINLSDYHCLPRTSTNHPPRARGTSSIMFTGQSLSPAAGAAAVGDAGSARGFGVLRSDACGGGCPQGSWVMVGVSTPLLWAGGDGLGWLQRGE